MATTEDELLKATNDSRPIHKKLARLPSNQKISKRPLLHPPVPHRSSSSATAKIVYVSSKSSFSCTLKRVRLLLEHVRKRSQSSDTAILQRQDRMGVQRGSLKASQARNNGEKDIVAEEVIMKSSGKAIEKGLKLAAWWSSQDNVLVELRTGSVGTVDDIVDMDDVEEGSRVRNISYLEVVLKLK